MDKDVEEEEKTGDFIRGWKLMKTDRYNSADEDVGCRQRTPHVSADGQNSVA